jgi:hypothetical protein
MMSMSEELDVTPAGASTQAWILVGVDGSPWSGYYFYAEAQEQPQQLAEDAGHHLNVYVWDGALWDRLNRSNDQQVKNAAEQHQELEFQILDRFQSGVRAEPLNYADFVAAMIDGDHLAEDRLRRSVPESPLRPLGLAYLQSSNQPPLLACHVPDYQGTWSEIDRVIVNGNCYFQLEHNELGDEVPYIIVDAKHRIVVAESVNNVVEDLDDFINAYGGIPDTPVREGRGCWIESILRRVRVEDVAVHGWDAPAGAYTEVMLTAEDLTMRVKKDHTVEGAGRWSVKSLTSKSGQEVHLHTSQGTFTGAGCVLAQDLASWLDDGQQPTRMVEDPTVADLIRFQTRFDHVLPVTTPIPGTQPLNDISMDVVVAALSNLTSDQRIAVAAQLGEDHQFDLLAGLTSSGWAGELWSPSMFKNSISELAFNTTDLFCLDEDTAIQVSQDVAWSVAERLQHFDFLAGDDTDEEQFRDIAVAHITDWLAAHGQPVPAELTVTNLTRAQQILDAMPHVPSPGLTPPVSRNESALRGVAL